MFQGARNTPKWKGVFYNVNIHKEDKKMHTRIHVFDEEIIVIFHPCQSKNGLNELKTIVGEDVG